MGIGLSVLSVASDSATIAGREKEANKRCGTKRIQHKKRRRRGKTRRIGGLRGVAFIDVVACRLHDVLLC